MFNPEIFKAYDIRGIYNQDFDDQFAFDLGVAYANFRSQEDDLKKIKWGDIKIVVGTDMRLSSPALKEKLVAGLVAAGVQVIDIGLVSTPTFYFGVANFGYHGGIMISASHNPSEWNGFKVVRSKARPMSGANGLEQLKDLIAKSELAQATTLGQVILQNDVLSTELDYELNNINLSLMKSFKIVADPSNGMGAQYLSALFSRLPGELIKINFDLDGSFPAHEADPLKEENVRELMDQCLAEEADLGIATDGDGDRVFLVDNEGKVVSPALLRGLLARSFLAEKPGAKIGYDVRPGKITTDLITASGGVPVVTRVGHSLIKDQMLKEDIYFAGESSGHFFLNMGIGCFEVPMIVIVKLLLEFSQSGQSVADYLRPYEKYYASGEINSDVADKVAVLNKLKEKYSSGKQSELDGLSVEYSDFWFNVRGSNTENKMRLNLEAISPEVMAEKRDEVLVIIRA